MYVYYGSTATLSDTSYTSCSAGEVSELRVLLMSLSRSESRGLHFGRAGRKRQRYLDDAAFAGLAELRDTEAPWSEAACVDCH